MSDDLLRGLLLESLRKSEALAAEVDRLRALVSELVDAVGDQDYPADLIARARAALEK
jgi:hypothetical protein